MSKSDIITIVFAAIFLGVCFWYYNSFWRPLRQRKNTIKAYIQSLNGYTAESASLHFDTISQGLQQSSLMRSPWRKYESSLVKHVTEQERQVYSTEEAEEFFSVITLTAGLNVSFFSSLAGIFTGLGILGTFVGLTFGLWGMDTGDTVALANGIRQLLGGANTAFLTSIFGIFLGLPFSFFHSKTIKDFQQEIDKFCEALDQRFPRKNIETLLFEQLAENRRQSGALNQLSMDIADSICEKLPAVLDQIADRIDKSLQGNMESMINSLSAKLDGQITELQKIADHTAKLNDTALSELGKYIGQNAGDGAKLLGDSLQKLSVDMAGISDNMKEAVREFKETGKKGNEELLASVRNAAKSMEETMAQMQNLQTERNEENIQKMTNLMDDMKGTMESIFEKMQSQSTALTGNVTQMNQAAEAHLTKVNASMEELLANIAEKIQLMQVTMERHEHEIHQTMEKMQGAASVSGDVVNQAGQTLQAFNQVTTSMARKMNDAADMVSATLESAADTVASRMEGAVDPIQSAADAMAANVNQLVTVNRSLNESVEKNAGLIVESVEDNRQSVKEIQAALANVQRSWGAYEEHFDHVSGEMGMAFDQLEKGVKQYNQLTDESLRKKLGMFDKSMGDAINRLASATEEFNDALEDQRKSSTSSRR